MATTPVKDECSVLCSQTPYHTYQSDNGILTFAKQGSLQPNELQLIGNNSQAEITIPLMSIILGFYYNPTGNTGITKDVLFLGTDIKPALGGNIYIEDSTSFNPMELDINLLSADTKLSMFKTLNLVNNMKFVSCSMLKMNNQYDAADQERQRSVFINNDNLIDYSFRLVYLDYTWLYRSNAPSN